MAKPTRVTALVRSMVLASALGAGQAAALAPEHEVRRLMLATEEAVTSEQWGEAAGYLNRLQQLEADRPASYLFFRGKVMLQSAHYNEARSALEGYIKDAGTDGQYYREALQLITRIEKARKEAERASANGQGESEPVAVIRPAGEETLDSLRKLYLADTDREALVMHLNSLLQLAGWRQNQTVAMLDAPPDIAYRVSVTGGTIQIQEARREQGDRINHDTETLDVFGVNPQVRWDCQSGTCWIYDPRNGDRLMQLSGNAERASEIARNLGRLIRTLQSAG
ncbi:MAG: hypothetical protein SVX28_05770 [Pseudomonadota bacterium]|nr:hypothetical protein [Pseudomonadota bacterium]